MVCHFVLFFVILAILLFVLFRFTASDYPVDIFKLLQNIADDYIYVT